MVIFSYTSSLQVKISQKVLGGLLFLTHTVGLGNVVGKRYRIANCDVKYHFCEAKSTLYHKVVQINFANIKTDVTQSVIDTEEVDKKGNIASPLGPPF